MSAPDASIIIRRAGLEHMVQVAPLFDMYRQFYTGASDLTVARSFITERLKNNESVIFLALADGAPAGFVQLYPSFSSVRAYRTWILNDLFVHADHRQCGIGRALMNHAAHFAAETGAKRIELSTALDNHTAQALYVSLGYVRSQGFCEYTLALDELSRSGA